MSLSTCTNRYEFERRVIPGLVKLAIKSGSAYEAVKEKVAITHAKAVAARVERREQVKAKVTAVASDFKEAVVAQKEKASARRKEFRSKVGGKLKGLFGHHSSSSSSSKKSSGAGGDDGRNADCLDSSN